MCGRCMAKGAGVVVVVEEESVSAGGRDQGAQGKRI